MIKLSKKRSREGENEIVQCPRYQNDVVHVPPVKRAKTLEQQQDLPSYAQNFRPKLNAEEFMLEQDSIRRRAQDKWYNGTQVKYLLEKREFELRREFSVILQQKLKEQFQEFEQFSRDYIYRPSKHSMSYIS